MRSGIDPLSVETGRKFDVVIVGGGLVGASLAVALEPANLDILVVESVHPDSESQPSFDERTVALTYSAKRIFDAMGIWHRIETRDTQPIEDIHISNRGHFGQVHLASKHAGTEALGFVVPTRVVGNVLWNSMADQQGLSIACPASVKGLHQNGASCTVEIEHAGETAGVEASLVVVADGGRSRLIDQLAITTRENDYGHSAVLCIVTADRAHGARAYERFTRNGPLALLPLKPMHGQHRFAVVWTIPNESVTQRLDLGDEEFIDALQEEFGDRAGGFGNPSPRKSYPLKRLVVDHPVDGRVLVMGNAAHTVHPVAGQGFNLGLRDVAALAELIYDSDPAILGEPGLQKAYARSRSRDVDRVNLFTHSLIRIFSNELAPLSLARNLGLNAIELFPPAKRFLLKRTMGLAGSQPRMVHGLPLADEQGPMNRGL